MSPEQLVWAVPGAPDVTALVTVEYLSGERQEVIVPEKGLNSCLMAILGIAKREWGKDNPGPLEMAAITVKIVLDRREVGEVVAHA